MQIKTIEQAIDISYPQLSKLKKEAGDIVVKTVLIEALSDLVMFFNVGKTMNPQQIVQTVDLILENYWYLRISEFKYCFNRAKIGTYGKLYDRIDGAIILEWLDLYLNERKQTVIEANINRNNELKKDTSIIEALSNKGISFNKIEKESKKVDVIVKSEREKVIQDAFSEFDKLYLTNEVESKGFRLISYEGKNYSMVEFSEMRLKEFDEKNNSIDNQ